MGSAAGHGDRGADDTAAMLHAALSAALRPVPAHAAAQPGLLVVGATGRLGSALLDALLARPRFHPVRVAVNAGISAVPRGLEPWALGDWRAPAAAAQPRASGGLAASPLALPTSAVLLFDRGADRLGRDRVFFAPEPQDLVHLAGTLHSQGVRRLMVLTPLHERTLPAGLRRGLAGLDEQALAALGFEHLVFVRPAVSAPGAGPARPSLGARIARLMLTQLHWMVPVGQRPLRSRDVADFMVDLLLRLPAWPAGTRVATAELLCDWLMEDGRDALMEAWAHGRPLPARRAARPW